MNGRLSLLAAVILLVSTFVTSSAAPPDAPSPNILYILCDDLGYGDVHALNPDRGKIPTPNIDRLAAQGMTFTDAHSGSSVCTPSRYGILTGRYAWRTRLQSGVLQGNSPPLIAPDRQTVPAFLKSHGYATAAIGKWHLGLRFGDDRWNDPIADGPLQHGFDQFFGISASLDMPPFAYIDGDRFPLPPTVEKKWVRTGPAAKDFEAVDVLPTLTRKAVEFVTRQGDARKQGGPPFFLYLAFTSPHTPIVPTPAWQGKSGLGPYGDFVMETDHATGQVLDALDRAGLADNTLVIFTSDNGCAPYVDVKHLESLGHFPSAIYRGYKADIWDGGHRIPFLVRWPGHVRPGSRTDALTCQTDLFATCADLLHSPADAEDSFSMLPALAGKPPARHAIIHHSINGSFAVRKGHWKLELCPGSGGWAAPRDPEAVRQGLPLDQLYDLSTDPSEEHNLVATRPEVVKELTTLLQESVADGRTSPGILAKNDVPIQLHRPIKPATRPAE